MPDQLLKRCGFRVCGDAHPLPTICGQMKIFLMCNLCFRRYSQALCNTVTPFWKFLDLALVSLVLEHQI